MRFVSYPKRIRIIIQEVETGSSIASRTTTLPPLIDADFNEVVKEITEFLERKCQ